MGTIQIDGSTPKLTIGNATAEDATILFDGNAQDFYIALDDSADDLLIGKGSTVGTTPAISIDENLAVKTYGDITMTGTTPVLTIGDAGAEDTAIVFDGNAQDFYIALDDSADDLLIGLGSTVGTTPLLSFAEGGAATFKNVGTGDDNPMILTLQTSETDMAANDVIGKIAFQAPDEGTGTDAILVSAAIQARAEGDHSSSSNATSLDFMTGASEAAAKKMSLTSAGHLLPASDDAQDLGSGSLQWRDIYTGDLNLNNTRTRKNEVDGTSGSWTIQEGLDNLFLLNRVNGKRYKFNLTEVK